MAHIVALCGGVGGAKLAFGLAARVPASELTIVVNTGDDFEHLGLSICPDIDTVLYTLSERSDRERGWGLAGESWNFMAALGQLGEETWFNLGDRDLATHVLRSRLLAAGKSLSEATAILADRQGVRCTVAPMTDQNVRTWVETPAGRLAFQHYFVRERCNPVVRAIGFDGAADARPSPAFAAALARGDLGAILICPSNPYLSVDPILAIPGVREALISTGAPILAVSPIIGGRVIKGPAAKLMADLGIAPSASAVAKHYRGLVHGFVLDQSDAEEAAKVEALGLKCFLAQTIMKDDADRIALAEECLAFAEKLRSS
jgi:LPPG:FO 2-phospho-L-lactate transferase